MDATHPYVPGHGWLRHMTDAHHVDPGSQHLALIAHRRLPHHTHPERPLPARLRAYASAWADQPGLAEMLTEAASELDRYQRELRGLLAYLEERLDDEDRDSGLILDLLPTRIRAILGS